MMKTKNRWLPAILIGGIFTIALLTPRYVNGQGRENRQDCWVGQGVNGYGKGDVAVQGEVVPKEPDYADASQWYALKHEGKADIFYIISTETGDYPLSDSTICHFADTYTDILRTPMTSEMEGVCELLSGQLNFYSPYYRQCSLQSFTNDSLTAARLPLATHDVRRAFAYYLENENKNRPFILAGYSQGAMIALELMREMDDATYSRMVAAYIIGASVPQQMLNECPRVRAAQGAHDTGVTICYNSVRDTSCAVFSHSALCINPVNWCTDDTPAVLNTEPSPLIPIDQQQKDHLTVTLDPLSNLLLVSGFTASDYILPLIGKDGNYHSREIWLYRNQLRENMQQRVHCYLSSHE
ncbi:MAG: DUF3089 domain-containing protein [Prevotella sp.]|nr:DUF3089 domain-containing protein [Prevotella sp.]